MPSPRHLVSLPVTVGLLVAATNATAQDAEIAWLKKHAVPMVTLETKADDDFADLAPLRKHIGDARIVMLGEQTHGDGAAFLAKTRLIAFLHEKMGFDVLCFESGLFECGEAWRAIQAGTPAREAMQTAVFPIWMRSQQLASLVDYVERRARSDRALELCGYDCQLTGSAAEALPATLDQIAALCYPGQDRKPSKDLLRRGHKAVAARLPMPESAALRFGKTIQILRDEKCTVKADMPARRHYAILLESLLGFSAAHAARGDESLSLAERFNPRDEQGGRNMVWLANDRFAGRKIIVWAASMHLVRNHTDIDTGPRRTLDYENVRSMGDHAAEALGDDVFVIACTAYSGQTGLPWSQPRPLLRANRGSLEDLCQRAGLNNAIVPLRGIAKGSFLDRELYARPLGNSPMRARWPVHVDAFVFQKTMTPSTQYRPIEERKRALDLVGTLKSEADRFRKRRAAGNPFADKGDFTSDWDAWLQEGTPDKAAQRAMEKEIAAWTAKLEGDTAVEWRGHALLGTIARRRGDIDAALTHFDRALETYPRNTHSEPIRHSARQHLVNDRAMAVWDRDGFDAALKDACSRLARDPSLFYFHPFPWLERLGDDGAEKARLLAEVEKAFGARFQRRDPRNRKVRGYLVQIRKIIAGSD